MKKVIVMLSLGVLFAGSSMAADGPGRVRKADLLQTRDRDRDRDRDVDIREIVSQRTNQMVRELDLNKRQEKDLQSLNMKHAQKMKDILKDDRSGRGIFERNQRDTKNIDKREQAQIEALDNQYESELKDILNSEQFRKYQRNRR